MAIEIIRRHQIIQAGRSERLEIPDFVTEHGTPHTHVLMKKLLKLNVLRKMNQPVEKVTTSAGRVICPSVCEREDVNQSPSASEPARNEFLLSTGFV
jgi:hypothetical protein